MNNLELEAILKNLPITVCCADDLPSSVKKRPYFDLTNTSKCQESGLHWTVFYFPKKGPCEFFDSLGENPETYHRRFRNVFISNGPDYLYTSNTIQPDYSNKCGLFCIYFIHKRCMNISHAMMLRNFSKSNLDFNDERVVQYAKLLYFIIFFSI